MSRIPVPRIILATILVVMVAITGCATSQKTAEPPRKTVTDYYVEAHERHFAALDKWMKGISEWRKAEDKCLEVVTSPPVSLRQCLERFQLPAPETYLPKDRLKDESFSEYLERQEDEWEEKACFYKARMNTRFIGEAERLEDQCKRDLEVKRLRKAVEKLNKPNQR